MRLGKSLGNMFIAMAMFAAVGAASNRTVLIRYDATVAGSHLASGEYEVQMETHSPGATVSFSHGKKVIATVQGKIVDRGTKYPANQIVYGADANGGHEIQEIRFKGSSEVVDFE